jgi:hypothetical protein
MKRILWGLGWTLAAGPVAFAQDGSPSARLRAPVADTRPAATIRAQAPEVNPAAGFDFPKPIPKGDPSASSSAPATLPVPAPGTPGSLSGPTITIPAPGSTSSGPIPTGPVIIDPPGAPFPGGPGGGFITSDPMPGLMGPGYSDPSHWYVAAEALMWWVKSYGVPPLVTVGPAFSGANLSVTGVTSVYGADSVDVNPRYGGRLTLGYWLSPCWAVELTGFAVRPSSHGFTASSTEVASSDLARPFYNLNTGAESSEIIGRPGVAQGFVNVTTKSNLYGGELNARYRYWQGACNRLDFIAGVRYLHLDEQLTITESSRGLAGAGAFAGIERFLQDDFRTKNRFLGGQVGAIFEHVEGRWTLGLTTKVAVGYTRQTADISGAVTPLAGGTPPDLPGGLLALNSNIGTYSRQKVSIVPEVGVNVGYDVTNHLRVFAGYSILYWTGVSRPGQQIDRVLDVNRIPDFPAAPATSTIRPVNPRGTENLWAQGVNFGIIYRW